MQHSASEPAPHRRRVLAFGEPVSKNGKEENKSLKGVKKRADRKGGMWDLATRCCEAGLQSGAICFG